MKVHRLLLTAFLFCIVVFNAALYSQYPNIRISKPGDNDFPDEPSIAVNPVNPLNLVAGANINNVYTSTDGGFTWKRNEINSQYGVWGDPCVIFDSLGNLYYGHLSNTPSPGFWIDRIVVQKSTDGGISFNSGAGIGYNPPIKEQDKEWLAADLTSSKFRNNVYAAWTEFDYYGSTNSKDSSRILFSRSTDLGANWSAPLKISDVSGDCSDDDKTVEGAVPAIGPNGEIYLSWGGPLGIMFDKSTDGGISFGKDIFVADQPGGWAYDIAGIYRANGMPVTACDVSSSHFRGNIYISWSDQRNGIGNTNVFFIKSTDYGKTWGAIKTVNDDKSNRDQFFNWMTIDQANGNIYIVFYDRRNTTGILTDVYLAKSKDGGETFQNCKISETSFSPRKNSFFGDYTNITALNGKIYPIWARNDDGVKSIYTAIVNDSPLQVELSTVVGVFSAEGITLSWYTFWEKNNKGFEVQRKLGHDFNPIGFVNGMGTTAAKNYYSFVDKTATQRVNTYRLKQIDLNGTYTFSNEIEVDADLALNGFVLEQNFPNPFNPITTIKWKQQVAGLVKIKVFDLLGKELTVLVNGYKQAGTYEVSFNGGKLTSGVYFYQLEAGSFYSMKQMMLIK